jgi:UDP-glucuronate 4-epimerase
MRFINLIEQRLQLKAEIVFEDMQPGDVKETYADIDASRADLGFEPVTTIDEGLARFVDWYRDYHKV